MGNAAPVLAVIITPIQARYRSGGGKLEFDGADLSNPVGADAHIGPLHMV